MKLHRKNAGRAFSSVPILFEKYTPDSKLGVFHTKDGLKLSYKPALWSLYVFDVTTEIDRLGHTEVKHYPVGADYGKALLVSFDFQKELPIIHLVCQVDDVKMQQFRVEISDLEVQSLRPQPIDAFKHGIVDPVSGLQP